MFHHVPVYMGDLHLVHPALNLSILNAVHLEFCFGGQVEGTILRCSYSLSFVVGPRLFAYKLWVNGGWSVVGGGLQHFSGSPSPLGFGFGTKGFGGRC